MADLDNFYKAVQMLLLKKNQDIGELHFLTSSTTTENKNNVEDMCQSFKEVYKKLDLPFDDTASKTDPKCISTLKYLVLNTNFEVQERLAEDIVNGHLVDMCPPLSPYLLIQIIWALKYEDVLIESLLYIPVDLCVEILETLRRCMEDLEFQRAMNITFALMLNIYKRCVLLKDTGAQSVKETDTVNNLVAHLQELFLLLTNPRIIRLDEVSGLKRHERYGVILKTLIQNAKICLETASQKITLPTDLEKLYELSFGRELYKKYDESFMKETMRLMNQELINLLLKKIKEIDCNIYLGWAELDDTENNAISLQRSIGNECYYFVEFIRSDGELSQNEHLLECLQQLSSVPDNKGSILTLEELRHGIDNGKVTLIKELFRRYKEWDSSMLDYVAQNKQLVDTDGCLMLLEYLHFVVTNSDDETCRKTTYTTVMKVLLQKSTADIYEIMVNYIVSHDADTSLESPNMEENFRDFISRNTNMKSLENVRVVLLFLMQNPKKVLLHLLRISTGHRDYKNIMFPAQDLLLFAPFMSIIVEENENLLSNCLRTLCTENMEWNQKKFADFTKVMLDSRVLSMDELTNRVWIPYLDESTFNGSNMNFVLNTLRKERHRWTSAMDTKHLLVSFAKQMSAMRKRKKLSKYMLGQLLSQITRLIQYLLQDRPVNLDEVSKRFVIDKIEAYLEPIDRPHFAPLWHRTDATVDIGKVMLDYDRKCCTILNKLKEDATISKKLRSYLENLSLTREDFLRHLILRSTEQEYHALGSDVVLLHWFTFGWNNETEAYENLLRITLDACCLFLEFPADEPSDTFVFLVKCIAQFSRTFCGVNGSSNERILEILLKSFKSATDCIKRSMYSESFSRLMTCANDSSAQKDVDVSLTALLDAIDRFCDSCRLVDQLDDDQDQATPDRNPTSEVVRYRVANDFISACMRVPTAEASEFTRMMDVLFSPS